MLNCKGFIVLEDYMKWNYQNQFQKELFLVNINESSINRNVISLYSWSFKHVPAKKRTHLSQSQSVFVAILSYGFLISFLMSQTIDFDHFGRFAQILNEWLTTINRFWFNKVFILLDNWSAHKSMNPQNLLKKLPYMIYYLYACSSMYHNHSLLWGWEYIQKMFAPTPT